MNEVNEGIAELYKEFELSRKSPEFKTIVVHPELYQHLVLMKGSLIMKWADPKLRPKDAPSTPTFADVIVEQVNRAIWWGQLMSRIIRSHPEVKHIVEKVAKQTPEHYQLVKPMLSILGKKKEK